jgi:hypothetical protein
MENLRIQKLKLIKPKFSQEQFHHNIYNSFSGLHVLLVVIFQEFTLIPELYNHSNISVNPYIRTEHELVNMHLQEIFVKVFI